MEELEAMRRSNEEKMARIRALRDGDTSALRSTAPASASYTGTAPTK